MSLAPPRDRRADDLDVVSKGSGRLSTITLEDFVELGRPIIALGVGRNDSRRDAKEAGLSKIQFASLQILESSSRPSDRMSRPSLFTFCQPSIAGVRNHSPGLSATSYNCAFGRLNVAYKPFRRNDLKKQRVLSDDRVR
jgi:hypothetical protein